MVKKEKKEREKEWRSEVRERGKSRPLPRGLWEN